MPWKECSVMDERLQFVARRLAGETMAELCRGFGISRKTGYKIFDRYQECGIEGLTDRSRRPYRYANQLPFQVENYILNVKREHASWGARKIRERLMRRFYRHQNPGQEHHSCSSRSPRPGQAGRRAAPPCARHAAVAGSCCKRPLVRRLQGRVQAWQWPLLLSADRHGSRLALPAVVRGARFDTRTACNYRLREAVPRSWLAICHSLRQRRALRQSQCLVQPLKAFGVVAPARYCDRTHQTRSSAAKRPP